MYRYLTCLLVFIFMLSACSTPITPGQETTAPIQMSATHRAASPTPPRHRLPCPSHRYPTSSVLHSSNPSSEQHQPPLRECPPRPKRLCLETGCQAR